jgi:hypothetical protein
MSLDANTDQSFAPLPPEPIGRNKSMGAQDWILLIQQTPGKKAPLHSPAAPSGTQHSCQIEKSKPQASLHLRPRETLGPPPLFKSGPHAGDHPRLRIHCLTNNLYESITLLRSKSIAGQMMLERNIRPEECKIVTYCIYDIRTLNSLHPDMNFWEMPCS